MHDIVIDGLEDHLAGRTQPTVAAHLDGCAECRDEVAAIKNVSVLLAELRPDPAAPAPPPFFYTRLASSIADQQNQPARLLLAPGALFFRRVAFGSLLMLACLGSYLAVREGNSSGTDAAAIMAQHQVISSHPAGEDRDLMLVTLASYR